jgi:hypothetical protein
MVRNHNRKKCGPISMDCSLLNVRIGHDVLDQTK